LKKKCHPLARVLNSGGAILGGGRDFRRLAYLEEVGHWGGGVFLDFLSLSLSLSFSLCFLSLRDEQPLLQAPAAMMFCLTRDPEPREARTTDIHS
jgi:hypothetical protein